MKGCKRCSRIVINISGMRYETYEQTLERFPETLLGSSKKRSPYYDTFRNEYFFDRNRLVFDAVLFYYQSHGILSCPDDVSDELFIEELRFFQIKDSRLKSEGREVEEAIQFIKGDLLPTPEGRIQGQIWNLFYNPTSSIPAGIIELISVTALLLVIALSCAETYPSVREDLDDKSSNTFANKFFSMTNIVCHTWFTIEYLVRFVSAADRLRYIKTFDSVIDICAIIPFFTQVALDEDSTSIIKLLFLRILRVLRVLRVLKITRYFRELRAIMYTLYASWCDLQNFFLTSMMILLTLSSLIYYIEVDVPGTTIDSIPQAMWWSINTYTTVGVGDITPVSLYGKGVATICMVCGLVCMGLPIYCLVNNFIVFWNAMQKLDPSGHLMNKIMHSIKGLARLKATLEGK